jgi:hypothetical protein
MRRGGSPKETASIVPTIGEKRSGVQKARPGRPNRIHIPTIRRLPGEKRFVLFFGLKRIAQVRRTSAPNKEKRITDVIIPAMVKAQVSHMAIPVASPVTGPKTNLNILPTNTVTYLINMVIIPVRGDKQVRAENRFLSTPEWAELIYAGRLWEQ